MDEVTGESGQLNARLLRLVDDRAPQLRAVCTTLLIKAVDIPDAEGDLFEALIASDQAAAMIDAVSAAEAGLMLHHGLERRLGELADSHGEITVVRTMRDHLIEQMQRWAAKTVDDADNRRRAERLLAWAEHPQQLRAAQKRGLFTGMDIAELRRLAATRTEEPVSAEAALEVWTEIDRWLAGADELVGERVIAAWEAARAAGAG